MNNPGVTFSAVLLVGGSSRRMGVDKSGLVHPNGLMFWQHQMSVLDQVGPDYLLVSSAQEPEWISEDMIWVRDDETGRGPVGGIVSALKTCATTHLICLGIDLVQMPAPELKYFCSCCTSGTGLVPQSRAGWEPLAAVFPRSAVTLMSQCMEKEEFKLQTIIDLLHLEGIIRPYPIPEEEMKNYRNINTPEEYELWKSTGEAL
ncbi:MAG: molybdenum cofactor guanylyltransferase [Verrucomicrobiota bacterium]